MHNSFNQDELNKWFCYSFSCWVCNKSHPDSFHHIMGRGGGITKAESSILNAAPVNNFICHLQIHGKLMLKENQKRLLQKTMRWLLKQGYKFNEVDILFIEKYKEYYDL